MVEPAAARQRQRSASKAIPTTVQPVRALRAIRTLLADPEDTRQAFIITEALRGRSGVWMFDRFSRSPGGAEVLARRLSLLDTLRDRARLDALPHGTLPTPRSWRSLERSSASNSYRGSPREKSPRTRRLTVKPGALLGALRVRCVGRS